MQILTWILGAYLALTGTLANLTSTGLEYLGLSSPSSVTHSRPAWQANPQTPRTSFLPSSFDYRSLSHILRHNLEYQAAAVGSVGNSERHESAALRDALVNIMCTYHTGNETRTTTGSGAFIDPRGIILTNAHVAQFLLLGDSSEEATCVIRQGSPAEDRYRADLLYLSPMWVSANAAEINKEVSYGTGERDYALLYVTESITGDTPDTFPALTFSTEPIRATLESGEVTAAGYPAANFDRTGPEGLLVPETSTTTVTNLYTFRSGTIDLIALAPSSVGEHGSSGGPILNNEHSLIGLIVTRGTDAQSLRAITTAYINETIQEETGFDLPTTLEGDIEHRSAIFKKALAPFLAKTLSSELEN